MGKFVEFPCSLPKVRDFVISALNLSAFLTMLLSYVIFEILIVRFREEPKCCLEYSYFLVSYL